MFRRGKIQKRSLENPSVPLNNDSLIKEYMNGMRTNSGVYVNEESSLGISTVWAAVRLLSGSSSTLPLKVYRENNDDTREIAKDHPVYKLIVKRPNGMMNSGIWREFMMASTLLWGNGYSRIVRDSRFVPIELIPYHPSDVQPFAYKNQKYFRVLSEQKTYYDYEFIHFIGYSQDGIVGKSPIRIHMENLGLTMAAQQFGALFFGNGTNMGGYYEHPGRLSDEAYNRLKENLRSTNAGMVNAHSTPILEEGLKFSKIGIPPEEAQFIETRKFQKSDIAAIFNVPPHLVGDLSNSTNNNIEQQSLEYVIYSLMPWLNRIENELNIKLFREDEQDRFYVKHNVNAILRGDMTARAQFYTQMISIGAYSQNDVRKLEDENPIEFGDTYYRQSNLIPINENTIKQALKTTIDGQAN